MNQAQIQDTVDLILCVTDSIEQRADKDKSQNFFNAAMNMLAEIVGSRRKVAEAILSMPQVQMILINEN